MGPAATKIAETLEQPLYLIATQAVCEGVVSKQDVLFERGLTSFIETGQTSAAETGQVSAIETRQMSTFEITL